MRDQDKRFLPVAILAALAFLFFIPGMDVAAWWIMHPAGFWQRTVVISIECLTVIPRFMFAVFIGGLILAIGDEVTR